MNKVCLFCTHICFSMYCNKNHWDLDEWEDDIHSYRKKVLMALTCNDFELAKMPWLSGEQRESLFK